MKREAREKMEAARLRNKAARRARRPGPAQVVQMEAARIKRRWAKIPQILHRLELDLKDAEEIMRVVEAVRADAMGDGDPTNNWRPSMRYVMENQVAWKGSRLLPKIADIRYLMERWEKIPQILSSLELEDAEEVMRVAQDIWDDTWADAVRDGEAEAELPSLESILTDENLWSGPRSHLLPKLAGIRSVLQVMEVES